jgi:uracil permease
VVLGAITFVAGVSEAGVNIGSVQLKSMALAAVTGIILALILILPLT